MLSNVLIIIASVGAAALFLMVVSRASAAHARKESNDFTGAVVAVIGTTYAVLLAFMLSGVWNMFQQAQVNAEQEANDLVNAFRISELFDAPARDNIQNLARGYAEETINLDFPSMESEKVPPSGGVLINQMWQATSQVETRTSVQSQALAELMSTLRALTEHRRIRILQSHEMLPPILWVVLIAGGVITVAACCFRRAQLSLSLIAGCRAQFPDCPGPGGHCRYRPALPGQCKSLSGRFPVCAAHLQ